METTETPVRTTLRIPGNWSDPRELIERMPAEIRLAPDSMIMPDGTEIDFNPMQSDEQFAQFFATSCRRPATADEMAAINEYTVNIVLTGPGGSMPAAMTMMQAGAAVVRAGGAGVFIDNSALAHGGSSWIELADDGSSDALSFAFVSIVRGPQEVRTMGMHVMGLRDVVMRCSDLDDDNESIVELIRYLCKGDAPIGDGHLLADENGPRFQVVEIDCDESDSGNPMYNPFGRLSLISMKDIAERN